MCRHVKWVQPPIRRKVQPRLVLEMAAKYWSLCRRSRGHETSNRGEALLLITGARGCKLLFGANLPDDDEEACSLLPYNLIDAVVIPYNRAKRVSQQLSFEARFKMI